MTALLYKYNKIIKNLAYFLTLFNTNIVVYEGTGTGTPQIPFVLMDEFMFKTNRNIRGYAFIFMVARYKKCIKNTSYLISLIKINSSLIKINSF